jgi:hypothetical protein
MQQKESLSSKPMSKRSASAKMKGQHILASFAGHVMDTHFQLLDEYYEYLTVNDFMITIRVPQKSLSISDISFCGI